MKAAFRSARRLYPVVRAQLRLFSVVGVLAALVVVSGRAPVDTVDGAMPLHPASVGDAVYLDANDDDTYDPGEGIGGVDIQVIQPGADGQFISGDDLVISTTTGNDGRWMVGNLPPGPVRIVVVGSTLPNGLFNTSDPDGTADNTTDVTLVADVFDAHQDFGYQGDSAVGDLIWNDIDGDGGQQPDEIGLPGIDVTATWAGRDNLLDTTDDVAFVRTTDANGHWHVTTLPPGTVRVVVDTADLPAGLVAVSDPDDTVDSRTTHTLAIHRARTTDDFGYRNPSGTAIVSGLVWRDSVPNGYFEPGSDRPLADQTVGLLGGSHGGLLATTTTDTEGRYRFAGLPAGNYAVQFYAPDPYVFTRPDAADDDVDSDADDVNGRSSIFSLGVGGIADTIDGGLYVSTEFSGTVYVDGDDDGMRDPGEPGIPDVTVTLTGTDDLGQAVSRPAVTDASGHWSVAGVRVGTYAITETQPTGYLDGGDTVGAQLGTPGDDTVTGITIGEGNPGPGYDFGELAPASLAGLVFDDTDTDGQADAGEPGIAGVAITLTGTDDRGDTVEQTTMTSAAGTWTFAMLRPGAYAVAEAQSPDYTDGPDTAGSAGGTASDDRVAGIVVAPGTVGTDYRFAEHHRSFDLVLVLGPEGPAVEGGSLSWLLHLANLGNGSAPAPVTVTDVLPDGLTYTGATGDGWTCAATGRTVTCTLAGPLAAGASTTLRLTTSVGHVAGTVLTNSATVTAAGVETGDPGNNSGTAALTVQAAAVTTTTTTAPTVAPTTSAPGATGGSGILPVTGARPSRLLAVAAVLLVAGLASLSSGSRRRRRL